ncbi:MAG TPA: TadE family protein [Elusimicrobiota bacterium]|nr:TadE family protein [Elusimicrobiota bacterium]
MSYETFSLSERGQSITETILVLPLFLALAFAGLQLAQLGVGIVMADYAASSVARKAAAEEKIPTRLFNTIQDLTPLYGQKATDLMVAGMKFQDAAGCVSPDVPGEPSVSLTVRVRATVSAFPILGDLLHGAWHANYTGPIGSAVSGACPGGSGMDGAPGLGPINFSASPPYYFTVNGKATVRMNYQP